MADKKRTLHRRILSGGLKSFITIESTMASTLGTGVSSSRAAAEFYQASIDVASLETFQKILDAIEVDLSDFSQDMAYAGFDKTKMAKLAAKQLGAHLTVKLCMLGGMRGTNLGKILDKSKKVDEDVKKAYESGKILSQGSGANDLTMGRLMATFPEIVAHYLNKNSVPGKLSGDTCPASLQFPAAAGLPMSQTVRMLHLEFAVKFSFLISQDKKFHIQYYKAAFNGQQEVKRLSAEVKVLCGNPTDAESRSFDIDNAMAAIISKYGADRFVSEFGASLKK